MKKNKDKFEKACYLCENAEKISLGEYCLCSIKGVVDPDFSCKKFIFDPLKMTVSVQKIPTFTPIFDNSDK